MVFFCQNNQWAISEPVERQSRVPLYKRSSGFGFPGVRIDGNDVLASLAVTRKALDNARSGQGPTLVEAFTYRMNPHTTSDDPTRYRLGDELETWKLRDPIERVRAYLARQAGFPHEFFDAIEAESQQLAEHVRSGCRALPDPTPESVFEHVYTDMPAELAEQRDEFVAFVDSIEVGGMITMAKALNDGLRRAMEDDPKVVIMGEDVGKLGGVFRVTDGLQKDFGEDRVIDTPLAESAIIGTAVGLAIRGYRPVCEIQFDGFVFPGFDQIVSQVAKLHNRSGGSVKMPITIRIPFGGGIGAVEHHSESPEAYFAHTQGLKVVACSNPSDAHWMIRQAVASDDPVVFFEPKRRYWTKGEIAETPFPLHSSQVVRPGRDVTDRRVRPDGGNRVGGRDRGRRRRARARDRRSAHAVALRPADRARLGPPHRPPGRGARGADQPRHRRRTGGPRAGAGVLFTRGAGPARRRLRHSVPAVADRRGMAARRRPNPRRRRQVPGVLMALKTFNLPDAGEGLTEADILKWNVQPGDTVEVNQIIVEIETAKAAVELPSPFAGVVHELYAKEGDTVDVGKPIITIDDRAGVGAPSSVRRRRISSPPFRPASPSWSATGRRPRGSRLVGAARSRPILSSPLSSSPLSSSPLVSSRASTEPSPFRRRRRQLTCWPSRPVRKLAKTLGVDLTSVAATGPNGTISRADVEAATSSAACPACRFPAIARRACRSRASASTPRRQWSARRSPPRTSPSS